VAAGKDQLKALIGDPGVLHLLLDALVFDQQVGLRLDGAGTSQAINRVVACRRDEPRGRIARLTVTRPAFCGHRERMLRGFLSEIEVAEEADQVSQDAAPLLSEDPLDQLGSSQIGRTSTAPPKRTAGIFPAISSTKSRLSDSNRK
jgi:hypothetical protein